MKKYFFIKSTFIAFVSFVLLSCSQTVGSRTELLMGTVCSVDLFDDGNKKLYDELFIRLKEIENIFSTTILDSEVSAVNNKAGISDVSVSREFFDVLKTSLKYAEITNGVFDPTVGPLVNLWGINTGNMHVPPQDKIDEALSLVNWQDVDLSQKDNNYSVKLLKKGMALDFGGIVKGYAADELVRILDKRKVKRAVIDLGGNIFVYGKKKDGSLWKVGVKNPNDTQGKPALILSLSNSTIVTSGVYERFFVEDGVRYHHILDTKTGYPAETGLLSSTIICESSMASDAFSTSVFALGKDDGMKLIKSITSSQVADNYLSEIPSLNSNLLAIFISSDGSITASKQLDGFITSNIGEVIFE